MKRKIFKILIFSFLFVVILFALFLFYKEVSYIPSSRLILQKVDLESKCLSHYYNDLSEKYLKEGRLFDKNGIPLYKINGKNYYHPVSICEYALGAYEVYLNKGDKNAKAAFLKCADWLQNNLHKIGKFYYWVYDFENTSYPNGLYTKPWFSAMAQGEGASVLLRAFCETKQERYLQVARKVIEPILHDFSDGGISVIKESDYLFPQEYLTRDSSSNILNGAIFTFFGLYDYYRVTGNQQIKRCCSIVSNSFLSDLPKYDTGYWSLYALYPNGLLASPFYHGVHIQLLKVLYHITGEEQFNEYSNRWRRYQSSFINRVIYVLMNHWRQLREFETEDLKKILGFIRREINY